MTSYQRAVLRRLDAILKALHVLVMRNSDEGIDKVGGEEVQAIIDDMLDSPGGKT